MNRFTTGNGEFVDAFTAWVLQETGVLKVVHTDHHRVNETEPREMYRIKDDVVSRFPNHYARQ
jgi:oligosaccharyltransferase complex subunit beta